MSEQQKIAKAGKLICIDSGEYSNYYVIGFFVVLRDFDPIEELAEYKAALPEGLKPSMFDKDRYLSGLLAKGLLLEIDAGTLHLGAYSSSDELSFTPEC